MKKNILNKELNPLAEVMKKYKATFWRIFWFSLSMNLLMLVIPLYLGQVIDNLVDIGSINNLIWISIIYWSIWAFYGFLLIARSFILNKIKRRIDQVVSPVILGSAISHQSRFLKTIAVLFVAQKIFSFPGLL